jgi:DNA-binding MarR family transcriptional regulator
MTADRRREPAPSPDDLGRLIAQARRLVRMAVVQAIEGRGEPMLAWQILSRLGCAGPKTQNELALAAAQHAAGVSRMLGELEARGLIARNRHPQDRRRMVVEATPAGLRWWRSHRAVVHQSIARVAAVLTAREQAQLRSLLVKLTGGG